MKCLQLCNLPQSSTAPWDSGLKPLILPCRASGWRLMMGHSTVGEAALSGCLCGRPAHPSPAVWHRRCGCMGVTVHHGDLQLHLCYGHCAEGVRRQIIVQPGRRPHRVWGPLRRPRKDPVRTLYVPLPLASDSVYMHKLVSPSASFFSCRGSTPKL